MVFQRVPPPPGDQPATPGNNLLLRQMEGMRRDMRELMEREARTIDLVNRLTLTVDESFTRLREDLAYLRRDTGNIRSDIVQMEMRVLTAIGEVRMIAARVDEVEAEMRADDAQDETPPPARG